MTARVTHWINGQYWDGVADRSGDVYDPATGKVTKTVDFASRATLDEAVKVAKGAFPAWRDASLTKRAQVLFAFRELLNANKEKVAALITEEHGKVLSDALGEAFLVVHVHEREFERRRTGIEDQDQHEKLLICASLPFYPAGAAYLRCSSRFMPFITGPP